MSGNRATKPNAEILMKWSRTLLACVAIVTSPTAIAMNFSLGDFLPGSDDGAVESVRSETVEEGLASAQATLEQEGGDGVRVVSTRTGMGIIASASAVYETYPNINATVLSKRAAYARAFVAARAELGEHLEGASLRCQTDVEEGFLMIDTADASGANATSSLEESCDRVVQGQLSSYIVYSVEDDVEAQEVRFSIASSDRTRSAFSRNGGAVLTAADPEAAWRQVMNDIVNFATPPQGSKLVQDARTGEFILVSFGSEIIRRNDSRSLQRRLEREAMSTAELRAQRAMVSFVKGDEITWRGGSSASQQEGTEQITIPETSDGQPLEPRLLEETKSTFLNVSRSSDAFSAITQGRIPPGVTSRQFKSRDGNWMFAVSVWSPTASASARRAAMENEERLSDSIGMPFDPHAGPEEGAENPEGPSGQVSPEYDF